MGTVNELLTITRKQPPAGPDSMFSCCASFVKIFQIPDSVVCHPDLLLLELRALLQLVHPVDDLVVDLHLFLQLLQPVAGQLGRGQRWMARRTMSSMGVRESSLKEVCRW